jgi:signal transduction histidine kinase
VDPDEYQPRLSVWGQVWRVVVVLVISGAAWGALAENQWRFHRWWFYADLALGLVSFALVFRRRRNPVAVATVTAVLSAVSGAASGPATLALVSLATRRRWRQILPVAGLSLVSGLVMVFINPSSDTNDVVDVALVVAVIGVTVGWGLYIGSRRELLATLRERARRAEEEQALRVEQAKAGERTRIAREMHDVLAHHISLVAMHSSALTYRTDLGVEQMRTTAGIIHAGATQALADLRNVLGLLREGPGDAVPEAPQPSVRDIDALVASVRAAGTTVDLDASQLAADVPTTAGRTVYRVVQEALTNARRHAPGARVTLRLSGSPDEGLSVDVRNPRAFAAVPSSSSGLGLVGLSERVSLAGGRLTHAWSHDGQFVLEAWIPWRS